MAHDSDERLLVTGYGDFKCHETKVTRGQSGGYCPPYISFLFNFQLILCF